jgi:HPr kinase/phosphorylase
LNLHASCVAHKGNGLLILGASGKGKSALALQMIALGADLVADDRTDLSIVGTALIASCPPTITGLIEARGIGILRLPSVTRVSLKAVVDLDAVETDRLPPLRQINLLGRSLDLIHASHYLHFPAALMCYLAGERAQ